MFPFTRTVLVFFIAGLLFFAPRARRTLGAYRIPRRPAFSSHLTNALHVDGAFAPGTYRVYRRALFYNGVCPGAPLTWTRSPVTRLIETNRLAWQGKPFDKGEAQVVRLHQRTEGCRQASYSDEDTFVFALWPTGVFE